VVRKAPLLVGTKRSPLRKSPPFYLFYSLDERRKEKNRIKRPNKNFGGDKERNKGSKVERM
jgi:hypothetical protein